jgi:hypothetical protein
LTCNRYHVRRSLQTCIGSAPQRRETPVDADSTVRKLTSGSAGQLASRPGRTSIMHLAASLRTLPTDLCEAFVTHVVWSRGNGGSGLSSLNCDAPSSPITSHCALEPTNICWPTSSLGLSSKIPTGTTFCEGCCRAHARRTRDRTNALGRSLPVPALIATSADHTQPRSRRRIPCQRFYDTANNDRC